MHNNLEFVTVENYLKTYSTTVPPYDFNGLLHLVLAGIENLRVNAFDQNVMDYACSITDEQAVFLQRLLDARPESIAQYENTFPE